MPIFKVYKLYVHMYVDKATWGKKEQHKGCGGEKICQVYKPGRMTWRQHSKAPPSSTTVTSESSLIFKDRLRKGRGGECQVYYNIVVGRKGGNILYHAS